MSEDNKDKKILDSDADGLSDYEEEILGTDPYSADTDKDGLGDYQEVRVYKTDPLNPDTDCDNMKDGDEVKLGRNPNGKGNLRDFFIPNKCNSFRPNVLHPKRIAFHAASAVIIKIVMVVFALSFPVQAWLSPNILYQQAEKIIQLTNNIRNELGVEPLIENQVLDQAALNKAQDMMINQYFAHVGPDDRALRNWLYDLKYNFRTAGENLAIGFYDANDVLDAWVASPTHYSNLIDPDFTEIGVGVVSGDYNGYETTLIAQYFGDPIAKIDTNTENISPDIKENIEKSKDYDNKIEQATIETPEETPEPPVVEGDTIESTEENLLPPVVEEKDLALVKNEEISKIPDIPVDNDVLVLEAPALIIPEDKQITNENINVLTIVASGAQRAVVYVDGTIAASKVLDSEKTDVAVNLEEGEHSLQLVAYQGDKSASSSYYSLSVDKTPPTLDQEKTYVLVNKPTGNDDLVLKANAYLSDDAKEAYVSFADNKITLTRDYSEEGKWTGYQIISGVDYNTLFNPIVMASLTAVDSADNKLTQDIKWQDIKPVAGSTINQYSFLRQSQSKFITPLFKIGNIYYQIMLIIALIALLLNIFIQIRKQHFATIASTLGFMVLLTFLTIF